MDNLYPVFGQMLPREAREQRLGQRSKVLWLTGLSGSGKSTIALQVEQTLFEQGYFAQVLDGDNIRSGINANLGFSVEDRHENIRRIAEVAKLYLHSGIIVITSFISPTIESRELARRIIGEGDFLEIFVHAPLEICEQRDVKGLYAKARRGELKEFTGIDSPYEPPPHPALEIRTAEQSVEQSVKRIIQFTEPLIKLKI